MLLHAARCLPSWEVARVLACKSPHQVKAQLVDATVREPIPAAGHSCAPPVSQVLRVEPTSTTADIKSAYRKLIVKVHPDKNSDANASQAMSIATEALKSCLSCAGATQE